MPSLSRFAFVLLLGWLAFHLFGQAREASMAEDVDGSRIVMLFGGVILLGATAGALFVVSFLPLIGDRIGNFFFNPDQKAEANPHSKALGYVARGDYRRAIAEYERAWELDPSDTLALSEIARLHCEKLHDPASAAARLEAALSHDWPPQDAAFLSSRLADVYWTHLGDAPRARALLREVIEALPGTQHAANAKHRLQEIERTGYSHG